MTAESLSPPEMAEAWGCCWALVLQWIVLLAFTSCQYTFFAEDHECDYFFTTTKHARIMTSIFFFFLIPNAKKSPSIITVR